MANKFGMFIHWGIYAQTKLHEQALARYDLPREEYEALAATFNPTEYDPEAWVLTAKAAGMEYICFTTKHHDGFCMWDTKYTNYSIMHTPYGKDTLRMLSDACHKHGMKLSLYYSIPDWHHPYGYNPASTHQWKCVQQDEVNTEAYREYVKNQVTELLTNYGEIYTFFWDIPPKIDDPSLNELVRRLQPSILINDRGYDKGDFSTPEREYQDTSGSRFTRMTEACNSLDVQSWGYREKTDYYSLSYMMSSIDRIMAMGGSYLLNLGPKPDGTLAPEQLSRLAKIGSWYTRMNGALTDHTADTRGLHITHNNPCIITEKNGRSYLHFYTGLRSTAIILDRYPGMPKAAFCLNSGHSLPVEIAALPELYTGNTGRCDVETLHIHDIPTDDYATEPTVIELQW